MVGLPPVLKSLSLIQFLYPVADGQLQLFQLEEWDESSLYFFARIDGEVVSFRKDLAIYLSESERGLERPFIRALPLPSPSNRLIELCLSGFEDADLEKVKQAIVNTGFSLYTAKDKPNKDECQPGFLLRASATKYLQYFICAANSLRQATARDLKEKGIVVQGVEQFLAFLETGVLSPVEPAWKLARQPVDLPKLDSDGHFVDWSFLLGKWFYAALDIQLTQQADGRLWTQTEVPAYAFADSDVIHQRDDRITVQIVSAVPGYKGTVVLKKYEGNRLIGHYRCKQYSLVQMLKDGDMSLLQRIPEKDVEPL